EELPSFAGQAASLDRDARFVAQGDDALLHDGLGTTLLQDLDGPLDRSLGRPRSAEHGLEQLSPWAATALQGELDEEGAFPRSQVAAPRLPRARGISEDPDQVVAQLEGDARGQREALQG